MRTSCSPGSLWRRSRAVGPAQRTIQHQAAPLLQHWSQMGGWFTQEIPVQKGSRGSATGWLDSAARSPAAGRHRGEPCRAGNRSSLKSGAIDAQRMGRALARHGHGSPQGRRLLLLSWVARAGHGIRSASTRACGRASTRATQLIEAAAAGRIRAFPGGIQRQQCAVSANAAGRRHHQDPEVRRTRC